MHFGYMGLVRSQLSYTSFTKIRFNRLNHRQISSGLSRPKIIDRTDCNAELPKLTLEGHVVSPLQHMKMQSGLTRQLASRFSAPKNIISPEEVQEYKEIIEKWVESFPPEYDFENPDTSKDQSCAWLFAHRFYIYTMACLLILNPIRHYMVKQYTWESPVDELNIRSIGIWYSLKLMKTLRRWVDVIYNRDGRLHFIIFSIFDTAAILCTAVLKDTERTIGNRSDVLSSIGDAVDMLRKLNTISKTSKTSYDILERLVRRLPEAVPRRDLERQVKRTKVQARPSPRAPTQEAVSSASQVPAPTAVLPSSHPPGPAPAPAPARRTALAAAPTNVPPPLAEGIPAAPIPAAPLPNPMAARMPAPAMAPHHVDYNNGNISEYGHQVLPQNINYMTVNHQGPLMPSSTNQFAEEVHAPHGWSGSSENTPPNMNEHVMPPFPTLNDPVGLDGGVYQQQIVDPGPEFNIENLTAAQMGELAPLWTWHSENLDFANMPPPTPGPNGYSRPM